MNIGFDCFKRAVIALYIERVNNAHKGRLNSNGKEYAEAIVSHMGEDSIEYAIWNAAQVEQTKLIVDLQTQLLEWKRAAEEREVIILNVEAMKPVVEAAVNEIEMLRGLLRGVSVPGTDWQERVDSALASKPNCQHEHECNFVPLTLNGVRNGEICSSMCGTVQNCVRLDERATSKLAEWRKRWLLGYKS